MLLGSSCQRLLTFDEGSVELVACFDQRDVVPVNSGSRASSSLSRDSAVVHERGHLITLTFWEVGLRVEVDPRRNVKCAFIDILPDHVALLSKHGVENLESSI